MHSLIRVFSSRLLPVFIGSDFITTTEPSATCSAIGLVFPIQGYSSPTYKCLLVGAYSASLSHYTFFSVHPDPNHVNVPCRSFPFFGFPTGYVFT